jgi:hypothetical protein
VLVVQFGDSVVFTSIVSTSKLCTNALWSSDVVRHCVLSAKGLVALAISAIYDGIGFAVNIL